MYNLPDPPYFLLVFGLFVGITSGAAFEATLRQKANEWFRNRSTRTLAQMQGIQLLLPFVGISAGVCVFLAAGLEVFGLPTWLSYLASFTLTLFIGVLVWSQLGQVLMQLEKGGSQALDLDAIK